MKTSQNKRVANKATIKTENEMMEDEATAHPSVESTALSSSAAESQAVQVYDESVAS
jgi:hypothetical protein